MTDDVQIPGTEQPLAPVIEMVTAPAKKPYPEMSNSEKLAELQHKDVVIGVLRQTIAEQEIALEQAHNERSEIEAKHTRFSRVIHANACLEIGARIISKQYGGGQIVTDEDLGVIAALGSKYGDHIQRTLEKKPDSDDGFTGNEPKAN